MSAAPTFTRHDANLESLRASWAIGPDEPEDIVEARRAGLRKMVALDERIEAAKEPSPAMTPLIAEIRSLMERATKGPFSVEAFNEVFAGQQDFMAMILAGDGESIVAQQMKDNDAFAFATAMSALPTLLALAEDGERLKAISDSSILELAENARRAIVGQPAGFLVDPGAGSAMERLQREEPSPTQYHDMALRGGHCETLYTGTSVEQMILHVVRAALNRGDRNV